MYNWKEVEPNIWEIDDLSGNTYTVTPEPVPDNEFWCVLLDTHEAFQEPIRVNYGLFTLEHAKDWVETWRLS